MVHVLVGDAIATNEVATKLVLPWALRELGDFVYLVITVKCANHQVNLAICSAATGVPAAAAAKQGAAASEAPTCQAHRNVAGVVVRLFKYLVNIYYEEFLSALHRQVARLEFRPGPHSASALDTQQTWANTATLYEEDVIPPRLR